MCSVNSEIFVSVLFSQIEPSRNHEITLPFTDVCKNHVPYAIFFKFANKSFNAIRENKILAKILNLQFFSGLV